MEPKLPKLDYTKLAKAMKKTAYKIEDALARGKWIEENYSSIEDRLREYNKLLLTAWTAPIRKFSDADFYNRLLAPLVVTYGDKVYSMEKIESLTGKQRGRPS